MKKSLKILIFVIIVIIVFAIIYRNKETYDGNLSNMGLVVEDAKAVYYNKYEKGIFVVKNGKEQQLTDETAYSLNIQNDKIYYLTIADFNHVLIKSVDKNGKNMKNIATISTSMSKFFVEKDNIYYITNEGERGICKIDLNGENPQMIVTGQIQDFYVDDDTIFYINQSNQISKISTSGEKDCVLNEEIMAKKIQIDKKWIYYFNENENALFRIHKNGKKNELVSVLVKTETYNIHGKYVYYLDKENSKIARMQIGKSNKYNDIANISTCKTKINVVGDEVYYLDKSQDNSQTYQIYRIKANGEEMKKIEY